MYHIRDKEFIRGNAPMTKEEVRAVTIAKLDLQEDSTLLDIGAGTGSIGIEASNYLQKGAVVGIECDEKAIKTIKENLNKFSVTNYTLIKGLAPKELPNIIFNRMFIGGSKGNMEQLIKYFLEHSKSDSKIVINAIALETLTQALKFLKKYFFEEIDVISLTIAKNKSIGKLNMMMGENPIYIISAKKGVNNG